MGKVIRRTTLLLLPGLDGTEIFFKPLVAALPEWVKPVVVTYPISGTNDYSELSKVIQGAVEGLDTFYVLGWSFSGPLALWLAAQEPGRVRGVILCASFIRPPFPGLSYLRCVFSTPAMYTVRLVHRAAMLLSSYSTPMLRRDKSATWARVPSPILAARVRAILALNGRQCLDSGLPPVLYVAGSKDRIVPRWNAMEIARELPSTKVATIDGPHLALYTNAGAAAQVIVKFMNDTEAGHQRGHVPT